MKQRREPKFYRQYQSASGRTIRVGDRVSIRHRKGLYVMEAFVIPRIGPENIWTMGLEPAMRYGKSYAAFPEHVEKVRDGAWPQTKRMRRISMDEPGIPFDGDAPPEPYVEVGNRPLPDERHLETVGPCGTCGEQWQRTIRPGPKPTTCPECK